MTIVTPHNDSPLIDARQSNRALMVRRGVQRLFSELRLAMLPEMTLNSGRRADLVALSKKGDFLIVEIKTSIEDFRSDRKWPEYRKHCDRLYFATHETVPTGIFPEECGLIIADAYSACIVREAPEHRLPASTRKVLTRQFAWLAAERLLLAELAANAQPI